MAKRDRNYGDWARIGASIRLAQIDRERAIILKAFPGIQHDRRATSTRPKRQMSAAARRAMSAGMKKYWARRKAGAKSGSKSN